MPGLDISKSVRKKQEGRTIDFLKILDTNIQVTSSRLSDKVKESIYLELGILLDAGVDIKAALELVESQQSNKKAKAILTEIKTKVVGGHSLSSAFELSRHFTPYEYFSIQIGEETGKLTGVLQELAKFYTKKIKQQRLFINTISYPVVIFCTSVGAVSFMLYFIVPMFSDIFKRFGGELPYITQMIISLSRSLSENILYVLLIIMIVAVFIFINHKKLWFRKYSYKCISAIPVLGIIIERIHLARFCTSMGMLAAAHVPLLRSVQLIKQMIMFYPIQLSLQQVEKDILSGKQLYVSLSNFKIYDTRMIALIKIGEEVNQLAQFFQRLAQAYSEEVEYKTSVLSTFLEPLIIIFLGIVVGFILVAMYLPMFQLSTSIGG